MTFDEICQRLLQRDWRELWMTGRVATRPAHYLDRRNCPGVRPVVRLNTQHIDSTYLKPANFAMCAHE